MNFRPPLCMAASRSYLLNLSTFLKKYLHPPFFAFFLFASFFYILFSDFFFTFLCQLLQLPHLLILLSLSSCLCFTSLDDWQPRMDLNKTLDNSERNILTHQSVVDKVEDDLQDAAEDGGQGDPQVDLTGSAVGQVLLLLCPNES